MQIKELLDRYIRSNIQIESESTRRNIRSAVARYEKWLGHELTAIDFDDDLLSAFLVELRASRSPATVNTYRSQICGFWTWMAKKRLVEVFPTVRSFKATAPEAVSWTEQQVDTLLSHMQSMSGLVAGASASDWWFSLHLVAFETGERVSALLSIEWSMIEEHPDGGGTIVIPAGKRKGGSKRGVYHLRPHVMQAVLRLETTGELIWNKDFSTAAFYRRYESILKDAGLPGGAKRKMHCMRRTHATLLHAAGGDATESLMHSSRAITQRSYIDRAVTGVARHADKLPVLGAGS